MSRKEPSFEQLVSYMASEKSDERFDIYQHCYARNQEDIVAEFMQNSELLYKRKNGNILYHEIISITLEPGVDRQHAKHCLHDIAQYYIGERCPRNMVYGCLHEDHDDHLHYHLMISANERRESKRHFLKKAQFEKIKHRAQKYTLSQYPELKQKEINSKIAQSEKRQTDSQFQQNNEKLSVRGDAMKRRTGSLPQREEVCQTVREAMSQTSSMENFCFFLNERGYDFYVRGKNFGVKVTHGNGKKKSYRFSTLGVHEDFQAFQDGQNVKHGDDVIAQSSQDVPSEVHRETEPDSMTVDMPEVEKVADTEPQKVDLAENTNFKTEKPVVQKSRPIEVEASPADEKEKHNSSFGQEASKKVSAKKKRATVQQKPTVKKSVASQDQPEPKDTPSKSRRKMKIKDILGIRETIKERKKAKAASRVEMQESIDQSNKRSEEQLSKKIDQNEKQTAKRTVDDVRKEFERMSEQKKESNKHKPKHSQ